MPVIGTNTSALHAVFDLNTVSAQNAKTIQRLSSGSKLTDASDNAGAVGVSSRLEAAIRRLSAVVDGAQTLISFSQSADGFLSNVQDQLVRMSELAARATNGAFSASDRANYSLEFEKLTSNITAQITNATFNGSALFGSTGTVSITVSADGSNVYSVALRDLTEASGSLVGMTAMDITTTSGASAAIGRLTTLLGNVAADRSQINSDIAALNFYIQNIDTERVNSETANSRVKDLEFAEESTQLAKTNILSQAATAMLAQANTTQPTVLGLLR